MLTILFLGFLIGMQHALEADHIAAVSSVAARQTSLGGVVRHGVAWGAGHSPTLLIFAGATILLDVTASESLAALLEFCVGVMLVLLGGHVLARLIRDRIHFHSHGHGDADPPGRLGDPEPAAGARLRGAVRPRFDPRHGPGQLCALRRRPDPPAGRKTRLAR